MIPVYEIVLMLGVIELLMVFIFLSASYIHTHIHGLVVQSAVLGCILLLLGWKEGNFDFYVLAVITFVFRTIIIPYFLIWNVRNDERIWNYREIKSMRHSIIYGIILTIMAYFLYIPLYRIIGSINASIPFVIILISIFVIVTRRNAIAQITGYVSMENSLLYMAAVVSSFPLILEMGILLDIIGTTLFAVVIAAEKRYGPLEVEELVG